MAIIVSKISNLSIEENFFNIFKNLIHAKAHFDPGAM